MKLSMLDIESAVDRSIWPEIPSRPDAAWTLWVERSFHTLSVEQVIVDRVGVVVSCASGMVIFERAVKYDEKQWLRRLALALGQLAVWFIPQVCWKMTLAGREFVESRPEVLG